MAPGPPDKFSNNRYHLLGDLTDNPKKKQRPNDFPDLPPQKNNHFNNPKYVLISSDDPKISFTSLSPFAVKKGIESISTEINSITSLRDGNLLILTKNQRVADKFLKTRALSNLCKIKCKLHDSLNSVKGVIYAPCLKDVKETEIVEEMKIQGVTEVYKFTKLNEDMKTRSATGKMVLTFDLYRLPSIVDVAWYKCKVDHYIPNPMMCKNCQRLGHTNKRCKGEATCPQCSLPPHDKEKCTRTLCTNCSGDHSSTDKSCPRYIQMKEILKIKTKEYCSLGEARRKYKETNPILLTTTNNSYASIANESPTKRKENINNQPTTPNTALNIQPSTSKQQQQNNNSKEQTTLNATQTTTKNLETTPKQVKFNTTTTEITKNQTVNYTAEITKANNTTENTTSKTNTNYLMSPLSSITQNLIKNNKYYVPLDPHGEDTMDLTSP